MKESARRIYLDHAATTRLDPSVRAAMETWLDCGNASSLYQEGRAARAAIDRARELLSDSLGCLFAEVLFTSGGTEAANLAIVGAALANRDPGRRRVLIGAAEHHCVLHTAPLLESLGYRVEQIPVDREARVRLDVLESMVGSDVLLVSVMHANNELGSVNPIHEVSEIAHRHGALLHSDAVQTFGKLGMPRWKVNDLGADLVTVSGHKIGGPKGVGAVYLRAGVKLRPLVAGGGQEREVRGGTENVATIVGMGAASYRAVRVDARVRITELRNRFLSILAGLGAEPSLKQGGAALESHAHVRFPGIQAETMLIALDRRGVAASSGAACSSGSVEPSHVLLACGYSGAEAREGLRFTFGEVNTLQDVDEAAERVASAVDTVRRSRVRTS